MKLQTLMKGLPLEIRGPKHIEITGICANSKLVVPGNLFIARKGGSFDGAEFIPEAVATGASAVLTDCYNPFQKKVTQILCDDPRAYEPLLASRFYHHPSKELEVIGITGTNGKTTTAYLIEHLLNHKKQSCGLIGTIERRIHEHIFPSDLTSPDAVTCQKLLREMCNLGAKSVVMEVSSHALMQDRVEEIAFDVAIFTNITPEHLDYHGTFEEYKKAKMRLFQKIKTKSQRALLNLDDPFSKEISKTVPKEQIYTYGIHHQGDVSPSKLLLTDYNLSFTYKRVDFEIPLIGEYNVYNVLAALAFGEYKGFDVQEMAEIFHTFPGVVGRLERFQHPNGIQFIVDFAHTEKALENVLQALKNIAKGRIITVFGCGGDRDQEKRPKMGKVAEHYSDIVIVTNDNPRTEDPKRIREQILSGMQSNTSCFVKEDRREAIYTAFALAQKQDIILIAGKGHEAKQIYARYAIPFSDQEVVMELLQKEPSVQPG